MSSASLARSSRTAASQPTQRARRTVDIARVGVGHCLAQSAKKTAELRTVAIGRAKAGDRDEADDNNLISVCIDTFEERIGISVDTNVPLELRDHSQLGEGHEVRPGVQNSIVKERKDGTNECEIGFGTERLAQRRRNETHFVLSLVERLAEFALLAGRGVPMKPEGNVAVGAAVGRGAGGRVVAHANEGDSPQGFVCFAVSTTVEAVVSLLS